MVAKANNDARRTILDRGKGEWTEKKVIFNQRSFPIKPTFSFP